MAAGRWREMTLVEQMANIGSEVDRALELLDLSLDSTQEFPQLKELARTREVLVDYFCGDNQYQSTESSWRKYFLAFATAVRKKV